MIRRLMPACLIAAAITSTTYADDADALRRMVEKLSAEKRQLLDAAAAKDRQVNATNERAAAAESRLSKIDRRVDKLEQELKARAAGEAAAVEMAVAERHADLVAKLDAVEKALADSRAEHAFLLRKFGDGSPAAVPTGMHVGTVIEGGTAATVVSIVDSSTAIIRIGATSKPTLVSLQGASTSGMVDNQKIRIPFGVEVTGTYSYDTAAGSRSTIWAVRQIEGAVPKLPTTTPAAAADSKPSVRAASARRRAGIND